MSDPIRLAVLGAGGRMGRAIIALALHDTRFQLTAAHLRGGRPARGDVPPGVLISDDLSAVVAAADVAIDFTRPELTETVAGACAAQQCALVSGTTGLEAQHQQALQAAAKQAPVFWAPNMSVGVNLLLGALRQVAAQLGEEYDVEIVETHHRHKVDAPSGTAIALGDAVAASRSKSLADLADYGRAPDSGRRVPGRIGFHSLRGGEVVGEHDVRLIGPGEELRLGHSAFSRDAFAAGALRAAAWLRDRAPGMYGMDDLLHA